MVYCDQKMINDTFTNISVSQYESETILLDVSVAHFNVYIARNIGVGIKDQVFETSAPFFIKVVSIGSQIWEKQKNYQTKFNYLSLDELLIKVGRNFVLYLLFLFALWIAKIISMKILTVMIAGIIFKIICDI